MSILATSWVVTSWVVPTDDVLVWLSSCFCHALASKREVASFALSATFETSKVPVSFPSASSRRIFPSAEAINKASFLPNAMAKTAALSIGNLLSSVIFELRWFSSCFFSSALRSATRLAWIFFSSGESSLEKSYFHTRISLLPSNVAAAAKRVASALITTLEIRPGSAGNLRTRFASSPILRAV